MKYKCKVLTPQFVGLVQAFIDTRTVGMPSFVKELKALDLWIGLKTFWLNSEDDIVRRYYHKYKIDTPKYTEIEFEPKNTALQTEPRIEWNGKIEKITSINEIIGYSII